MSTDISYSLSELEKTRNEARRYAMAFSDAFDDIDKIILQELPNDWVSKEIHTYEEFSHMYNEKRNKLIAARDWMLKFCVKLDQKIMEFQDAADSIKQSFQ